MAVQTKGFCKYCGNEYTKAGMLRHLSACKKRNNEIVILSRNNPLKIVWFFLPICNSPRMGVCGYEGSEVYPCQFEQDKE